MTALIIIGIILTYISAEAWMWGYWCAHLV